MFTRTVDMGHFLADKEGFIGIHRLSDPVNFKPSFTGYAEDEDMFQGTLRSSQ